MSDKTIRSSIREEQARLCGRKRSLEEAGEFARLAAGQWRMLGNQVEARNQEQLSEWLRELQILRDAMNMDPGLIKG